MRTSTGVVLTAVGAILLLAVHIPLPWLSLKIAGLVIMCAGLIGLRIPQRIGDWLRHNQDRLMETIDPSNGPDDDAPRVPLDTLLDPGRYPGRPTGQRDAGPG
jgi:hypothetical protein